MEQDARASKDKGKGRLETLGCERLGVRGIGGWARVSQPLARSARA